MGNVFSNSYIFQISSHVHDATPRKGYSSSNAELLLSLSSQTNFSRTFVEQLVLPVDVVFHRCSLPHSSWTFSMSTILEEWMGSFLGHKLFPLLFLRTMKLLSEKEVMDNVVHYHANISRHNLTHVNKQHAFMTENRSKYTNLVLFVLFEFPLIRKLNWQIFVDRILSERL